MAGLIGGAPTFVGTLVGYRSASVYLFVLFLALAAGALIYVTKPSPSDAGLATQAAPGWALLIGFLAGYATDLFLTPAGVSHRPAGFRKRTSIRLWLAVPAPAVGERRFARDR